MQDYTQDLNKQALSNNNFRRVIQTGNAIQVVVMSLAPEEDIGTEVHRDNEQVLICLQGKGRVVIDDNEHEYCEGDMVLVRAGHEHNFINSGEGEMKIVTVYSPPHHKEDAVHQTKLEAMAEETED